jgi:serine/threonine-protein kinase
VALLEEHIEGKYEILEKMREGGMGAIYKVRHRLLDEVRVVKVIRSQTEPGGEAGHRFLAEAKAAIKLRHPNVATLHDFAMGGDGNGFIVMEFIDGWTLLEVLKGYGPPPLPLTLEIARQALKALGYLHRHKIVHRDISPDNLMLTRDVDGHPLIKLIDLGIAKALEGTGGMTTTGVFLGKPRYGSPERFAGEGFDERSDLYSFGVVLYELLTGRCPIQGQDPASFMAGHLFRPPLGFDETDPEGRVPEELREVVLKALAKRPDERIGSAEEFVWTLTMIEDRFPLTREGMDEVWSALQPLSSGAAAGAPPEPPGSTQDRLDLEFGMVTTPSPPPALQPVGQETRRTVPEAPTLVIPVQDLDSTWSSRELRKVTPPAQEPSEAPLPIAHSARGAAAAKPPISWGLIAGGALLLLAGIGGGAWWLARPEPAPEKVVAADPITETQVVTAGSAGLPPVVPAAAPPVQSAPEPVPEKPKPAEPRTVQPEEPALSAAPAEPMQPGDLIRPGPGVESPEVRNLPAPAYPAAAQGSGKTPRVRVAVLVDENGFVIGAEVREGDGAGLGFNEAALEAARRARFFPATRGDVPGKMWTDLMFEFAEPAPTPLP